MERCLGQTSQRAKVDELRGLEQKNLWGLEEDEVGMRTLLLILREKGRR